LTSTTNANTNTKTSKTAAVVVITLLPSSLLDQKIDKITAEPHGMPMSCELGTTMKFSLSCGREYLSIFIYILFIKYRIRYNNGLTL
jgi:hypothetical protein